VNMGWMLEPLPKQKTQNVDKMIGFK
jgi:hypothetical protein